MTAEIGEQPVPLPLWRTIAGFGVFAILAGVLLLLAPSYVDNYRLTNKVKAVVAAKPQALEEDLRTSVLAEAKAISVAVLPGNVKIGYPGGKLEVRVDYVIQKSLGLYHVDLHFHPSVRAK